MGERERINDLVALIDGLENLLDRSGLSELEVEYRDQTVVLRLPSALAAPTVVLPAAGGEAPPAPESPPLIEETASDGMHPVKAPLTGVFYRSPSPGAEPYVREGDAVSAGQVIGLIEAMKLFNEIKSDVTGTVRRVVAGDGELVKARETLIEVEPA